MCLNLPFEVKNQMTFYKVKWFKEIFFLLFSIFNVFRIFKNLQIFFYKSLLKWGKMKKILSPAHSLKFKNIIWFFEWRFNFFFEMVISATLFWCCPTVWKSTLKMTTLFRRCLTWFNSTLKYTTLFQRCWML